MKFRLQDILKVLVSLSALVLIIIFVDFSEIFSGLQKLSVPFVVAALLFYTGCQWLSCWRWQIILRSTGYRARMGVLFSSYFGGMFLNTLLPGAVGGDAYRVYRIAQQSQQSELAFVSVFLERITGVFALLAIALISIPPAFSLIGLWDVILLLVLCTAMVAGMVMLIASPRLLKFSQPWLNRLKLGVLKHTASITRFCAAPAGDGTHATAICFVPAASCSLLLFNCTATADLCFLFAAVDLYRHHCGHYALAYFTGWVGCKRRPAGLFV